MFDRIDEIERRWRFAASQPWQIAQHPEGRLGYRLRDHEENTMAYVPDSSVAEALRHAASDVAWLMAEVATLRNQIREMAVGGGAHVLGKSRQADITLATFKLEGVEEDDEEK